MPITAEQERVLLNKYKLTSLHPTEWPRRDDSSEDEDDDDDDELQLQLQQQQQHQQQHSPNGQHLRQTSTASRSSRFRHIDRHVSLKSSISGSRHAQNDVGVQKDEPDALGMAPSVAAGLRQRGLPIEDNIALRNKFMLSSTSFSPTMYLAQVHHDATTEDLLRGLDHLSKSIEQKSASLRVLVESNFERFVKAKATIDKVYTFMRTQGVEQASSRVSQIPASAANMRPHSRQTSRNQSHFRNTSGPWGSQNKASLSDKRKNALTKESDYGVQGIKAPLQELSIKAEEVWGPALGGREKEETLKAVQNALEQYRDVFALPEIISESIRKSDYDGVVDAYRKAKGHADKAKKIASIAKENNVQLGDADVQQIIVTAGMWYTVIHKVDTFKQDLWRRLKTSHGRRPAMGSEESDKELHMELLATLLQLGVDENPIWVWVNTHYLYLKDRIASSFERGRIEIEIQRRRLGANTKIDNAAFARHLRSVSTAIGALRLSKEATRELDTASVLAFWDKVQACMSNILSPQNGILAEVIEWYSTAQEFVENKAQKSFPTGVFAAGLTHLTLEPAHVDGIRDAALDLATIIQENVLSFFQDPPVEDLSDLYSPIPPTPITPDGKTPVTPGMKRAFSYDLSNIPPPSPKNGEAWEKYAFWPPGGNSLSGAHYLAQLLTVIGSAMGVLASLSAVRHSTETEKLKTTVTAVRERCITAICSSWNSDSERCDTLESWTRSPDRRDLTLLPAYFEAWEEKVLTHVQKIAYITDAATGKTGAGAVEVIVPPSAKLLSVVRGTFTASLYKSLNSMVENAEQLRGDEQGNAAMVDPDGVTRAVRRDDDTEAVAGTEAVDASSRNVRMLLTLSNLTHLRSEVIPQLISHFEAAFSVKLVDESRNVREVLSKIDSRLFQAYIRPTVEAISRIVEKGITAKDWEPNTPRPTDAQPYIYDVLLLLVLVHAEVSSTTSSTLTGQVLSYLLEESSHALISAFKKREHYSLTALMQATLDVEFMAQTLNNFTTDKAGEIQSQIYLALDERTNNEARTSLQGELPEMRGILKKLREGTKGEFGCFRRERRGRK